MFDLVELPNGRWRIENALAGYTFEGDLKQVAKVARKWISLDQIEFGIIDANRKSHDTCHFGMKGHYLFSFNQSDKKK